MACRRFQNALCSFCGHIGDSHQHRVSQVGHVSPFDDTTALFEEAPRWPISLAAKKFAPDSNRSPRRKVGLFKGPGRAPDDSVDVDLVVFGRGILGCGNDQLSQLICLPKNRRKGLTRRLRVASFRQDLLRGPERTQSRFDDSALICITGSHCRASWGSWLGQLLRHDHGYDRCAEPASIVQPIDDLTADAQQLICTLW